MKTIINYDSNEGLMISGDVRELLSACSQIIVRISDITDCAIDEIANSVKKCARDMDKEKRIYVGKKGNIRRF